MKISKDDFDLVKRKFGDDGDNLTWTDGEVLLGGERRSQKKGYGRCRSPQKQSVNSKRLSSFIIIYLANSTDIREFQQV